MQDLDIIAIIQSLIEHFDEAAVFFNINSSFRDFCQACKHRFSQQESEEFQIPVLPFIPFCKRLLELYPVHGLVFVRGCITDDEVLDEVIKSDLTQDIHGLITEALIKDRAPSILVYVAHLLQTMFRSPTFYADFANLGLPASELD